MNTNKISSATLVVAVGLSFGIGYVLSEGKELSNAELLYGDSGFPKNCRAIIKNNIDGYHLGDWNADAALNSIDRNCGEFGYSW